MKKVLVSTLLVACAAAPTELLADSALPAAPSVEATVGAQNGDGVGMLDLFVPLFGGMDRLLFTDARVLFSSGDSEVRQGSLGLGYRFLPGGGWTFGINGYYDFIESDLGNQFNRLGFGIEALSTDWELRANAYLPFGDTEAAVAAYNAALIEHGRLIYRAGGELAMRGFDAEVGYRLPVFAADDLSQLKAFVGGYWYDGDAVESAPGVSARVELSRAGLPWLGNGSRFTLVAGVSYDDQERTAGTFLARLRVPLGETAAQKPYDPLYARVERADRVRTYAGAIGRAEAAVYADTGQKAGRVLRANARSTAGDLNARIAAAGDGALVIASGEVKLDETLRLGTGSMLAGGGSAIVVRGARSGGRAVYRAPGKAGTLNGTDAAADVLAMADDSMVRDLSIIGGYNAITASGIANVYIQDVAVLGAAGSGILASDVDNLQVRRAVIADVGGDGIAVADSNAVAITGTDISATGSDGIELVNVDNALIAATRIHDLTICEDNTACEWSIFDPDTIAYAAISALDVTGLTLRDVSVDNVTYGLFVGSRHTEVDWELETLDPSRSLTIDGFTLTNSRREAMMLVNVEGGTVRNVAIDNTAMDRSMDLVVIQKSTDFTFDGLSLKGGINGLMFASSFNLPGETARISVSNAIIEDASRAGVFLNPATDISFSNVTILNPGSYGFYFYGSPYSFLGGPVGEVSFDTVSVADAGISGVYVSGPIRNFDGNIAISGSSPACTADAGPWSGTVLEQTGSASFSLNGVTVPPGALSAGCGL